MAEARYTVVGAPGTRALRVLWLLEELGIDYALEPAPPRSDAVRALDPAGKVPLLLVDGSVLNESLAIMTFLADRHGSCTKPAGTLERARQDGFSQFCLDCLESPLWTAAKHTFVLPKELRVRAVKEACRYEFAAGLEILEGRLGDGPYLMGDEFTLPDILCGHCARWAAAAKFELRDGPLGTYFERVLARPALQRAQERAGAAA